jgi:hypothetical protein
LARGEQILVADEPHIFAGVAVKFYCDKMLWNRLSDSGVAFAGMVYATFTD